MGYTHYMGANLNRIAPKTMKKIVEDVKKIEKEMLTLPSKYHLFDGMGETKGVDYSNGKFAFNGGMEYGHETFSLDDWFCKTNEKPYDMAVVATLLCIKYHINSADITTDGDNADWSNAYKMFAKLFSIRGMSFKIEKVGTSNVLKIKR